MPRFVLALLFLSLLALPVHGAGSEKEDHKYKLEMRMSFMTFDPVQDFGATTNNLGVGLDIGGAWLPAPDKMLGVGLEYGEYGDQKWGYELPLVGEFDLVTDNKMINVYLAYQWRLKPRRLQPYLEGRVGHSFFFTLSSLAGKEDKASGGVSNETQGDSNWYVDGGAGMIIRLAEYTEYFYGVSEKRQIALDFKVSYHRGGTMEYLSEGDVHLVDDVPSFNIHRSKIDYVSYQIGLVFRM